MECGNDCRAQKFRNDFGLRIRSGGLLKSGRAATGMAPHAAVPGLLGFFLLLAVLCFALVLIARKIPALRRIL